MQDDRPPPLARSPEGPYPLLEDRPARPTRRLAVAGLGGALVRAATPAWPWTHGASAQSGGPSAEPRGVPAQFDPAYVKGAVEPYGRAMTFIGPRLTLPMIELAFGKEAAIPPHLWGMLYDGWAPNMREEGLSVFIQGYEGRGPHNARKRIYMSALTPDLYRRAYARKIQIFLDALFDPRHAGRPLMRHYYAAYWDLYWDLHLGVRGDAVPREVREIGDSFVAAIGFWNPSQPVVYENYMRVRELRGPLRQWIDARVEDVLRRRVPDPEATFAHYWLENGGLEEDFRRRDIVFECFHNFLAFSQWGNTLYNVMARLEQGNGDRAVQGWFRRTMEGDPDAAGPSPFTPLDRFVMELFRTISPNEGSFSTLQPSRRRQDLAGFGFIQHPHPATSRDPRHWADPDAFDPDRYLRAPRSDQVDESRCRQAGLARCPFPAHSAPLRDGRDGAMANSGYGTVYGVVDGRPCPVVDHAGYAPFGFGYRRCAGEHLTMEVLKDVLRRVWRDGIEFVRLSLDRPERLPVGPATVITDDIGFVRRG
jgi:hypothetical protein